MKNSNSKKIFARPKGYICIPSDLWADFEDNKINGRMLKLLVGLSLDKEDPNFPTASNDDLGQMYSMHSTLVCRDITKAANVGYLSASRIGHYRQYSFPEKYEAKFTETLTQE